LKLRPKVETKTAKTAQRSVTREGPGQKVVRNAPTPTMY